MAMEQGGGSPHEQTDRIQLCGRLAATIAGRQIDDGMKGREERSLFAYLVLHRLSPVDTMGLVEALWPDQQPSDAGGQVDRLLRRLRRLLGNRLELRPYVQLRLPTDSFVDIEVAAEAIHRSEAAVAREDWSTSWPAARIALHTARRMFLPGAQAPWVQAQRRRMGEIELRAHACIAATGLGLGGNEVISAERSARVLIEREPLRESGYRHLMAALARRGNLAEAIQAYAILARRLAEDIGIEPSPEMRVLRDQLTRGTREHATPPPASVEAIIRTFMFTDICDSTPLVTTIGDQAWRHLLEWHDRLTAEVIDEHHGELMDRAGDGMFTAFDRPADAVRCAVTLQRRLAAHRVEHGFAPLVRIGIHTDQAVPTGGKYVGRGVHLAARVAAIAGPGEIVLTGSTARGAEASLQQRRQVLLKGLSEPVEVGVLRWD
jgi:SARP family transcriptional regulator, regulator of embCAB operon